jgi:hypothetical protein
MQRTTGLVAIAIGVTLFIFGSAGRERTSAEDGSPTPAAPSDLGLVIDSVTGVIGDDPTISWRSVADADAFELTGTLTAHRISRNDPFCTQPSHPETRTITLDERLDGDTTSFTILLPQLPAEEGWFVSLGDIRLRAIAADGRELGSQGGGVVAEAICARPNATPPSVQLPSTGDGAQRTTFHWGLAWLIGATGFLALGTGIIGLLRR